jgi:N-acetylneuraminic acid mutarotase
MNNTMKKISLSLIIALVFTAGCKVDTSSSAEDLSQNNVVPGCSSDGKGTGNNPHCGSLPGNGPSWRSIAAGYSHASLSGYRNATFATYWTGQKIITWGDVVHGNETSAGEIYNPVTNSWSSMSRINAPRPRTNFASAFTGTELLVWGGMILDDSHPFVLNDGGAYNLATNTWSSISHTGAPVARLGSLSVWTGSKLIVWGGQSDLTADTFVDGGVYNRATDTWSMMNSVNAPSTRRYASAVWSGREMIVWGGVNFPASTASIATGARYNPATNTWAPMSSVGAPSARGGHTAVWTGSKMIVWGGGDMWASGQSAYNNDGAAYDPETDTWTPLSPQNAPAARSFHGAVWTGTRMVVWGGYNYQDGLKSGSSYDPDQDKWESLTDQGDNPDYRFQPTLLWTGQSMYVLGGLTGFNQNADMGAVLGSQALSTPTQSLEAPLGAVALVTPWIERSIQTGTGWSTAAFGGGLFVAVGEGAAATSSDGIHWTTGTGISGASAITYGVDRFVALSRPGSDAKVSTDGIHWTSHPMGADKAWTAIAYGNGRFVALAASASPNYNPGVAVSIDGVNWTLSSVPANQITAVAFGNGKFVAIASNPALALVSSDGINWTSQSLPSSNWWQDVTYGNGIFVAMGYTGGNGGTLMATSTDGITWTQGSMPSVQPWGKVAFGNGKFVAVSYSGNASAVSTDAMTWDLSILPTGMFGFGNLVYGNGVFAAFQVSTSNGSGRCMTATF